jgi:DNA-binding CsgD family transcriptional regulator/tetratricopeptide (TPR) repeat protein
MSKRRGRNGAAARELAIEALALARAVGDRLELAASLQQAAIAHFDAGDVETTLDLMRECETLAQGTLAAPYMTANLAVFEIVTGNVGSALDIVRRGVGAAQQSGREGMEFLCLGQELMLLLWSGKFEAARRLIKDSIEHGWDEEGWLGHESELALYEGDLDKALAIEDRVLQQTGQLEVDVDEPLEPIRQVSLYCAAGDVTRAVELAAWYIRTPEDCEGQIALSAIAYAGYRALLAAMKCKIPVPPDLRPRLEEMMQGLAAIDPRGWHTSINWGWFLAAKAFRNRLEGRRDPAQWEEAISFWRRFGYAYWALDLAAPFVEDLLATGHRDRALGVLGAAQSEARLMGAKALVAGFEAVARREHVHLDGYLRPASGPLARLTQREREVLELAATGATNRAIGEKLFISEKTVSVHMSNLMAKLQVTNRADASRLVLEEAASGEIPQQRWPGASGRVSDRPPRAEPR